MKTLYFLWQLDTSFKSKQRNDLFNQAKTYLSSFHTSCWQLCMFILVFSGAFAKNNAPDPSNFSTATVKLFTSAIAEKENDKISYNMTVDEIPQITLKTSFCGAINVTPTEQVKANGIAGASGYRFNIYDDSGSILLASLDRPAAFFRFTQLYYVYGTTYQVKVQVKQGEFYGAEGAACSVTVIGLPVTTLQSSFCDAVDITPTQKIRAIGKNSVSGYRFNIYDSSGTYIIAIITCSESYFRFTDLNYTYGTTYLVKVQVKKGSLYGAEGAGCSVTMIGIPEVTLQASYCNATDVTSSEQVRANGTNNASGYRFNIYDATGSTLLAALDRSVSFFRFNQMAFTDGDTYQVGIQVKQGLLYGSQGALCMVTLGSSAMGTRQASSDLLINSDKEAMDFQVIVYPNPSAENFKLAITSESDASIQIRVYDMIGKLLEDKMVKAADIQTFDLGNRYPSGVYNLIVTQDSNIKTVRIIKR